MALWSVASAVVAGSVAAGLLAARFGDVSEAEKPSLLPAPTRYLMLLRGCSLTVVTGTLAWSWFGLRHVQICSDADPTYCIQFVGAMQFSTFTRWCWMVQGVYYLVVLLAQRGHSSPMLARFACVLFEVSAATALQVTAITYTVLVPGALLLEHAPHRRGSIEILLSPQGHIMHCLNTVFIVADAVLNWPASRVRVVDLPYGLVFCATYLVFEWFFHAATGMWHYPFLDYDRPCAELIHLAILAVFSGFWLLWARLTAQPHAVGKVS